MGARRPRAPIDQPFVKRSTMNRSRSICLVLWHRSLARWPSPPRQSNRGADLICLATGSNDPVLFGAWLEPGQHVTSIVASNKGVFLQGSVPRPRREFDDAVVARGVTTWDRMADLGELVAGKTHGRRSPDDITVFKQNSDQGVGFMALANLAHDKARAAGIGVQI